MTVSRRTFALAAGALVARPLVAADSELAWLAPPALKSGDTIALVAPAGPASEERVLAGKRRFEALGYKVVLPPGAAKRRDRYLAGGDDERAAELNRAFADDSIRMVLAIKGGYGLTRILDRLDYAALRKSPKIVCGFSDLTALHLAIARHARLVTLHSPMVQFGLYRDGPGFTESNALFWQTARGELTRGTVVPHPAGRERPTALKPGKAHGRLVGGNLTLVAATLGTPYQIEADGNVLFVEDTGEAGFRIDRLFSQLRLSGLLGKFSGVVLGTFDGTDAAELATVARDYFAASRVPVVVNYPVGHTAYNNTLAHGARVELDADAGTLTYLDAPVAAG